MQVIQCCLAALFVSVLAAGAAEAQERVGLKDFYLGEPLSSCPDGSTLIEPPLAKGTTECSIKNIDTVAGQRVLEFWVAFVEGQIVSVLTALQGGSAATSSVRDALVEVYGRPTESKSHIDEYTWRMAGRRGITVKGNRYSQRINVFVVDAETILRLKKQAAEKNKADL